MKHYFLGSCSVASSALPLRSVATHIPGRRTLPVHPHAFPACPPVSAWIPVFLHAPPRAPLLPARSRSPVLSTQPHVSPCVLMLLVCPCMSLHALSPRIPVLPTCLRGLHTPPRIPAHPCATAAHTCVAESAPDWPGGVLSESLILPSLQLVDTWTQWTGRPPTEQVERLCL